MIIIGLALLAGYCLDGTHGLGVASALLVAVYIIGRGLE